MPPSGILISLHWACALKGSYITLLLERLLTSHLMSSKLVKSLISFSVLLFSVSLFIGGYKHCIQFYSYQVSSASCSACVYAALDYATLVLSD